MPGGEIQLSAYGSENQILTGNPQITFFKETFKRYTNFAMEHIDILFEGSNELSFSGTTTMRVKIPRNADLLKSLYLRLQLPDIYSGQEEFYWTRAVGLAMINHVDLFIGSTRIERLTGEFLDIWSQIHHSPEKRKQFQTLVGDIPELSYHEYNEYYRQFNITEPEISSKKNKFYNGMPSITGRELHIPLNFWFMRNTSCALPLIALQYMDIEVVIEFKAVKDLYTILVEDQSDLITFNPANGSNDSITDTGSTHNKHYLITHRTTPTSQYHISKYLTTNMKADGNISLDLQPHLEANYIFLDEEERRRFASTNQEYLIEQTTYYQELGVVGTSVVEIEPYHPVKEFYFTCVRDDNDTRNEWLNYTSFDHRPIPTQKNIFEYNNHLWNGSDLVTHFVNNNLTSTSLDTYGYVYYTTSTSIDIIANYTPEDFVKFKSYWPYRKYSEIPKINFQNYKAYEIDPLVSCEILFQGFVRQNRRSSQYFNELQSYEFHTSNLEQPINIYSFALDPESSYQPSGACNFSRLENMQLNLELKTPPTTIKNGEVKHEWYYNVNVYMINYNILTISGGMGGLRYAN